MTPAEEAQLVAAAQAGGAGAFSRLIAAHQQAVRGFLRRLGGNHADADDLAQEAFLTAWSRLSLFRRGESLRAWLCGIAYRKWLTHRRGEARRGVREAVAMAEEDAASMGSPDARLDASAALSLLGPDERACVALCLAAEFSHAEAAQALGLPLGTVKSHVTRGRAKLVKALGVEP